MSSARGLLRRVAQLETGAKNPMLAKIGSLERFERGIADDIAAGRMCAVDGPKLAECVRRWITGTYHYNAGNGIHESYALPEQEQPT